MKVTGSVETKLFVHLQLYYECMADIFKNYKLLNATQNTELAQKRMPGDSREHREKRCFDHFLPFSRTIISGKYQGENAVKTM